MTNGVTGQFYLAGLLLATLASSASAQIIPDASLPVNSRATVEGNRITIDAGTAAGTNLFHSFDRFDVPAGTEAFFNNNGNIDNILTRVTGGSISNIDGLIRANGTANLFLINPNGMVFGPNASLDIGGSFVSSSASGITFGDGLVFSATNAAETPLLSVNVPVGLQFGNSPGNIINRSVVTSSVGIPSEPEPGAIVGLQVQPGNTLALVGGNVTLDGGYLTAPGGRIELGSVGEGSQVTLNAIDTSFNFGYENVFNFGSVEIASGSIVDVSGDPAGTVEINAGIIRTLPFTKIVALNFGSQPGGDLNFRASELVEFAGAGNYAEDAQSLELQENFEQRAAFFTSGVLASTLADGDGGNITIAAPHVIVRDSSFIQTATLFNASGNGGDIEIDASLVEVTATLVTTEQRSSDPNANGGNLTIDADRLTLQEVAVVGTLVRNGGAGTGGNLTVEASESIDLIGAPLLLVFDDEGNLLGASATSFVTGTLSSGPAGEIRISTQRLRLSDGAAILATSTRTGEPGNAIVNASESVELVGVTPDRFQFPSSIQPSTFGNVPVRRDGGNLVINTGNLSLRDGASLSANTVSPGLGGSIEVNADRILLDNEASIEVETTFGSGGNIVLRTDNLQLRDDSQITVTAGNASNLLVELPPEEVPIFAALAADLPQDGGNLTIETDTLVALENSDIIANSQAGFGGQVNITATAIFGTEFRDIPTSESDITASSALGSQFSGTVELRTPDIDATSGALALDPEVFDRSLVVTDLCQILSDSEFYVTGRGGIPENPRQFLEMQTTLDDLGEMVPFSSSQETEERANVEERANAVRPYSLTEATNWTTQPDGTIALVNSNNSVAQLDRVDCETGQGDEMVSYRLQ